MSDGKYQNLRTCAVTGQVYEAGDYVIKAAFGTYIVKASVNYTPELREETEGKLRATALVTEYANAPMTDIVRSSKRGSSFDNPPSEGGA